MAGLTGTTAAATGCGVGADIIPGQIDRTMNRSEESIGKLNEKAL